jgi:hypothetical protein
VSLAAHLRDEGGLLAAELTGDDVDGAFAVEAIREGWILHSEGRGRVLAPADPDLALLGGDRLYALGLDRLAEDGDLQAIAALADVISECARSHAEDAPDRAREAWRRLTLSDG